MGQVTRGHARFEKLSISSSTIEEVSLAQESLRHLIVPGIKLDYQIDTGYHPYRSVIPLSLDELPCISSCQQPQICVMVEYVMRPANSTQRQPRPTYKSPSTCQRPYTVDHSGRLLALQGQSKSFLSRARLSKATRHTRHDKLASRIPC